MKNGNSFIAQMNIRHKIISAENNITSIDQQFNWELNLFPYKIADVLYQLKGFIPAGINGYSSVVEYKFDVRVAVRLKFAN
nr:hypothetical protein [Daejeonella rubra]